MKKIALAATALVLAAAMLAGCAGAASGKQLTRGIIEDNVYTSEYAEITFTAPDGWTYATEDQLASLAGISADKLSEAGMPVSEEALKQQGVYDMMAMNSTTGSNVMVMYENLSVSLLGVLVSEDNYLESLKSILEKTDTYNYEFGDVTEGKIGLNTFKVLPVVMTDYDATQYYYVRKIDKYMLGIIITVFGDDSNASLMEYFS